jgi:hypothetical protein
VVGAFACLGGLIQLGWRRGFLPRSGDLLQPGRRIEELVAVDVRVARDRREVGVTEVLGDEAGVADFLAEPRRGCVAQRVGGDMLLDPSALRRATDYVGEDRLLQASAREPAEDRASQREGVRDPFLDLEPPPKPRQERDWLTCEEFRRLLDAAGRPERNLPGLADRDRLTLLAPPEELAQEEKAPVVRRLRGARPLPVRAQIVDDRRLLEDAPPVRLRPVEQVVDGDSIGDERALALLRGFEATQPIVARLPQRESVCRWPSGLSAELAESGGEDNEGRPVVRRRAGVCERCLERSERGAIGTCLGSAVCGPVGLRRLDRDDSRLAFERRSVSFRESQETAVSPPRGEPDGSPTNRVHRKSPVTRAFP